MMEKDAKIYVAGHRGMVGSAIARELQRQGYKNLITKTHAELDLFRQADVEQFFAEGNWNMYFLQLLKLEALWQTRRRLQISCGLI